jgi:alanine racemase
MTRSEITVDLGALRRNVAALLRAAGPAEVWAVVKANAYGHGALDCARSALSAGARALCVATAAEGAALRAEGLQGRILVLSPLSEDELAEARHAGLEVAVATPDLPEGLPVHLKVDSGMGRFGMALETFAAVAARFPGSVRHLANSAATLSFPEARFDAVRCGIALYGLSPFGGDPADHGLEPVLSWRSHVAQAKFLGPGGSTGYGRRFVAERETRIGLVPVGYGDGFRRGLTGTQVLVGGSRRAVLGTVSMDSFAVELENEPEGTDVTLIGDGLLADEHARHLGTINYEITTAIVSDPRRAERRAVDG